MCLSGSNMDGIESSSVPSDIVARRDSEPAEEAAVYVRNSFKSYGVGKHRSTVLRNLAMNVKKGTM